MNRASCCWLWRSEQNRQVKLGYAQNMRSGLTVAFEHELSRFTVTLCLNDCEQVP